MLPGTQNVSIIANIENTSQTGLGSASQVKGTVVSSTPQAVVHNSTPGLYQTSIQTPSGKITLTTQTPLPTGTSVEITQNTSTSPNSGTQSTLVKVSVLNTASPQIPHSQISVSTPQTTTTTTNFTNIDSKSSVEGVRYSGQITSSASQLPLNMPTLAHIAKVTPAVQQQTNANYDKATLINGSLIRTNTSQTPTPLPQQTPQSQTNLTPNNSQSHLGAPAVLQGHTATGAPKATAPFASAPLHPTSTQTQTASIRAEAVTTGTTGTPANTNSNSRTAGAHTNQNHVVNAQTVNAHTRLTTKTEQSTQDTPAQVTKPLATTHQQVVNPKATFIHQAQLSTGPNIGFISNTSFTVNSPVLLERVNNQQVLISNVKHTTDVSTQPREVISPQVISQVLKEILPSQQPLASSFNQLNQASANGKADPATRSLLSLFGVSANAPTSSQIKQNMTQNGTFTESQIKQGKPIVSDNLKALLGNIQKSEQTNEAGRLNSIVAHIGNRIIQQQLQSLLSQPSAEPNDANQAHQEAKQTYFDLPVLVKDEYRSVNMTLEEEDVAAEQQRTKQWQLRLNVDLDELGKLNIDLKLNALDQISLTFWCSHPEGLAATQAHTSELKQVLEGSGLSCQDVSCFLGVPADKPTFKPNVSLIDVKT